MARKFQFAPEPAPELAPPVPEDPEQPDNSTLNSGAAFYLPHPDLEDEGASSEPEPEFPLIPATQYIAQHAVIQAPALDFAMPQMVHNIMEMFLLRWGFSHLVLPFHLPASLPKNLDITRSFAYRPSDLVLHFNGVETFECWTLRSLLETIMIYPDLQEALFYRNDEPDASVHWDSSQLLRDFLAKIPRFNPLTTASLMLGDPVQRFQTAAAHIPHLVPGEPNFELIDSDDPGLTAPDTIMNVPEGPPVSAIWIQNKKEYKCSEPGCHHKSTTASNRKMHEYTHHPPRFRCPKGICARKSQDERRRSGTDCLPECERTPCGELVCQKIFTQNGSLLRHIIEHHTMDLPFGCPVETCEMRAKRYGIKCEEHGERVKRLRTSS